MMEQQQGPGSVVNQGRCRRLLARPASCGSLTSAVVQAPHTLIDIDVTGRTLPAAAQRRGTGGGALAVSSSTLPANA